MANYTTSVDICNRGLEMIGSKPIVTLTDNSINATEVNFVYDKLRRAELRRSIWRFAIRRSALRPLDTNSLTIVPPAWNATTLYMNSAIVTYSGILWQSTATVNYDRTPGTDNTWVPFFGSLQTEQYDTTLGTSYFAGETLYYPNPATVLQNYYEVFTCLTTGTTADPTTIPTWASTATYSAGQIVTYSASPYISLVPNNLNFTPGAIANSVWSSTTTYASGDQIVDPATGKIYQSQTSSNTGNNPLTDNGTNWAAPGTSPYYQPWLAWGTQQSGANWSAQPAGYQLLPPTIVYPINAGPLSLTGTQNVFMLPNGYLRRAPMTSIPGQVNFLGGPAWNIGDDYQFEGNYFVSNTATPIIFRFVADITYVPDMDPMFCEGLAAKIALAVYPRLSQKDIKQSVLATLYKEAMVAARMQSSIETGAVIPAQDTLISVRI